MVARYIALGVLLAVAPPTADAKRPPKPPEPTIAPYHGPKPPWLRRRRRGVTMRAKGQGLIDLSRWPAEPKPPKTVQAPKLARALRTICGWMPPKRSKRYASWLIEHSAEFSVDPFLVGALLYRQSLCVPNQTSQYGAGLTGINEAMHRGFIRRRRYRYYVLENGKWQRHERQMKRYLFYPGNLRRSRPSIYFAAALLSIYRHQWPALGRAFRSVPYRHFVSHFIWGDKVRDAGPEDRVLRARRRLLQYYHDKLPEVRGRWNKIELHPPLDGPPLKITSGLGDLRADGRRRHLGIDFSSTYGEPVRAVAPGTVIIAGIDAKYGPSRNMSIENALKVKKNALGAGGLYVMVRHADGLFSAYMHLAKYRVKAGQKVKAGQILGLVGRSGMKKSAAHLHFELRVKGKHIDPTSHLAPFVFRPEETYLGQSLRYERWRSARWKRYLRAKARKATMARGKKKKR
jgi:hypothetical protein